LRRLLNLLAVSLLQELSLGEQVTRGK